MIQAAPSGPAITPCGADPAPSGISRTSPVAGIEVAERPVVLAGVPDAAVGGGRDVVRVRAVGDVELTSRQCHGPGGCGVLGRGRRG